MRRRKLCNPQCRASVVRLNVGGRAFDTTRETLVGCDFFRPILDGNIGSAVDVNGRVFVDRSPELFAVLLQFLRICQRPALDLVDKHALLNECNFFGCEWLAQILRGEISPYDLRAQDRALHEKEREALFDVAAYKLIDVHKAESSVKPRGDLQIPLLALNDIMRTELYGNFTDFYKRLNSFSGGLIDDLVGIGGICIAGGSILSALVKCSAGDIDIYVTVPPADAPGVLRQVFNAVQQNQKRSGGKRLLLTRTKMP